VPGGSFWPVGHHEELKFRRPHESVAGWRNGTVAALTTAAFGPQRAWIAGTDSHQMTAGGPPRHPRPEGPLVVLDVP
jgi:hypothetical protein